MKIKKATECTRCINSFDDEKDCANRTCLDCVGYDRHQTGYKRIYGGEVKLRSLKNKDGEE